MIDVFNSVKSLLKIDQVCIDNNMFRLHYKVTFIILVALSVVVTSRQYIGEPINCIVDGGIAPNVMDTYCWIYSTFINPARLPGTVGKDIIQPGVGNYIEGEDSKKFYKYYQWVCFVLFFQGILFYVPRYVWKSWEGGKMKTLVMHLNSPVVEEETKNDRLKLLMYYFCTNLHEHNFYAIRFFICEVLNLINVTIQIYFMNYFLNGEFTTYGMDVLDFTEMDPELREDPMARVFPKITKCIFHKYGPSGTIQKFDGMCILSLNIVNEKIYVFLWFWFVFLAAATVLALVYRVAVILLPGFRFYVLRSHSRLCPVEEVEFLFKKCQIGDWFIFCQLSKNINQFVFKELVSDLVNKWGMKAEV